MLNVYSIFNSISGEAGLFLQGSLTTFIRLAGCNIRCKYCDTSYALNKKAGTAMFTKEIVDQVLKLNCKRVLITGGEPLLQASALQELVLALASHGCQIAVETNGTIKPSFVTGVDCYIVDWKLGGSGMSDKMLSFQSFIAFVPDGSWVKFVCADEADLREAITVLKKFRRLFCWYKYAISAIPGFPYSKIIERLQEEEMNDVVVSLQIHKYIYPGGEKEK